MIAQQPVDHILRETMSDADLLDAFVALFEALDWIIYPDAPIPAGRQTTDILATKELYGLLPAKFPRLYEQLILTYRWQCSTFGDDVRILANPHGSDLSGLQAEIFRDKALSDALIQNGFIQFAFASSTFYDPICFQTNHKTANDYPIVRIDHEKILCNNQVKIVEIVASSFRKFVENQIATSRA